MIPDPGATRAVARASCCTPHGTSAGIAPPTVRAQDIQTIWQGVAIDMVLAVGQTVRPVAAGLSVGGSGCCADPCAVRLILGQR